MSVGRSVGWSVGLSVTHSFDDPHVVPYQYWPTWPCSIPFPLTAPKPFGMFHVFTAKSVKNGLCHCTCSCHLPFLTIPKKASQKSRYEETYKLGNKAKRCPIDDVREKR